MDKIFDTDKRIRLGIWGLGRGQSFINSAKWLNLDVVAGCDINAEMRKGFHKNVPDAFVTADEDEFLALDFDAVLVATYLPDHTEHAIKALRAGKHVMCEVTAFMTPADGVRLVEAVEASGKIYHLLENCPFSKANMYLKKLWDEGFFGDFIYGEYEYVHCVRHLSYAYNFRVDGKHLLIEPGWVVHNWRAALNIHYYNTHSLGPLMHITGLRPVAVEAFPNAVLMPGTLAAEGCKTSNAASLIRMSNGGVMRNLMGGMTMDNHAGGRLWGTRAGADKMDDNRLRICIGADGSGLKTWVDPEWPAIGRFAETAGHGGADFWELYYFAREILTGEKGSWDVYAASDVTLAGILAARSARQGGAPQTIPDFRDKHQRDAYRDDHDEGARRFDPGAVFPADADKSLVGEFNAVMVELYRNDGAIMHVYTVLQGMRLYDRILEGFDRLHIVTEAIRLKKRLPEIKNLCEKARRMADAYPDSVGGRTLAYGLDQAPLDAIMEPDKTIARIDAWLDKLK
ncbi:MAG: Gfo/Idh/MocA family oxidoreductase [Lentisphaerae bacterium]|nr:Gfo/Idh/MocA family oxidoreductase [Lentisphaerota bacterium]